VSFDGVLVLHFAVFGIFNDAVIGRHFVQHYPKLLFELLPLFLAFLELSLQSGHALLQFKVL
jgi:hypothetical protein